MTIKVTATSLNQTTVRVASKSKIKTTVAYNKMVPVLIEAIKE